MENIIILLLLLSAGAGTILYVKNYIEIGNISKTFDVKSDIIGFGKAQGLYLILSGNHYLVAGKEIKNKYKAIREFIEICNQNDIEPENFKILRRNNNNNFSNDDKVDIAEAIQKADFIDEDRLKEVAERIEREKHNKQHNINTNTNNYNNKQKNNFTL
jgi:hypothetical protein